MADSTNPGGSQPNVDPSKTAEPADPFANINLDELPDDVRASLTQAKTAYTKTVEDAKTAESRRAQAEEFARTQQSRADKASAALQRHNIPVDGPPNAKPISAEDAFVQQFMADGLPEAQAKAYGKMFVSAGAIQRDSLLRELGPLAHTVGNIQADSVLAGANSEYAKIMAIPEVAKEVRDNATVLVNRNQVVDKATVDSLVRLAYGEYMLKNPQGQPVQNPQQTQIPTFGGTLHGGGGYVPSNQNNPNNQAPRATQPETVTAMESITKFLRSDLKSTKK